MPDEGQAIAPPAIEHRDNRGVFVELWSVDVLDGDFPTAVLLSQVLWWHQPAKDGEPKLRYERDGFLWLVRPDDGWWEDCRMTLRQVRRSRGVLVGRGFIVHRRFKVGGAPTSAWRPVLAAVRSAREAKCANPELPSARHFLFLPYQREI